MEWLVALVPAALVVLVCGGLHALMMRGMHGGHRVAGVHGGHHTSTDPREQTLSKVQASPAGGEDNLHGRDGDRVAELQRQVTELQQEIDAMIGSGPNRINAAGSERNVTLHQGDCARRADSGGTSGAIEV